jgi:hypothetical protein
MKLKSITLLMVLVMAGTVIFSAVPVFAKKPVEMNIIVTQPEPPDPSDIFVLEELPNELLKISFTVTQIWSGDWDGINVQSGTAIARSEDIGNFLATIKASGVFTGTIDGKTGTVSHRMRNNINPKKGYFANTFTILQGTGELANIHGQGSVGEGWVTVNVHFDP